jgi:AraC-like DNA-binding protein
MLPLRITTTDSYPGAQTEIAGVEPSIRWLRAVPAVRPGLGTSPSDGAKNAGSAASEAVPTETLRRLAESCRYSSRELARFLGISQRQLQRIFRARLGCTPQAFLREERLQAAERLLHSASSVKEVAYALGFCQQSQFSRDFKERFGRRPSAIQRAGRQAPVATVADEDDERAPESARVPSRAL